MTFLTVKAKSSKTSLNIFIHTKMLKIGRGENLFLHGFNIVSLSLKFNWFSKRIIQGVYKLAEVNLQVCGIWLESGL